jgi:DeoR family suf operon transcriptional repressor
MRSTKERILNTLLNKHNVTIGELADVVGINGVSVRHHLINLQAEGLITAEEERHGVGRPRFIYKLSDKGYEQFPSNYLGLTNLILDVMDAELPKKQFEAILENVGLRMAETNKISDPGLPIEAKLDEISIKLAKGGFRISHEREGNLITIFNKNCPYHRIGINHPKICQVDQVMYKTLLGQPVNQVQCMLTGDKECRFTITMDENGKQRRN